MAIRLWTALVLLVAVFTVHGLQCATAGAAVQHGSSSAVVVSVGGHAAAGHLTIVDTGTPGHSGSAALDGGQDAGTAGSTGQPTSWHDAHVLAVCLAVLLAGLTLLGVGVGLRGRGVLLVRGSPGRGHRFAASSMRPRPPDLSVLCLLRI